MSIVHVPFYPSDWLAGTRGLSAEETGVYITLLARIYEMAGPIERDDARLARLCGCKTKARFVRTLEYLIQEGKLIEVEGGLFNERAQKEIQNVIGKSAKARGAAESRWGKKSNKNNSPPDANASPEHMPEPCQPKPKPNIGGGGSARVRARDPDPPPENPPIEAPTLRDRILLAMGLDETGQMPNGSTKLVGGMVDTQTAASWQTDLGLTEDQIIAVVAEVTAAKTDGPPSSFRYFNQAMQRAAGALAAPKLIPIAGGKHDGKPHDHRPQRDARAREISAVAEAFSSVLAAQRGRGAGGEGAD